MASYIFERAPFQSCLMQIGSVNSEQNRTLKCKKVKGKDNGHTPVTPSNGKRWYDLELGELIKLGQTWLK